MMYAAVALSIHLMIQPSAPAATPDAPAAQRRPLDTSAAVTQPRDTDPGKSAPAASEPADLSPLVSEGVVDAPSSELWKVWTTAEGFRKLGVAKADVDLRVGGLIRSHYDPQGTLGDEGTIENQIIAFEPERMLAIRIHQPPKGFPFPEAWKKPWTVVTLTDLGDNRTHVRVTGLGYDDSDESRRMRDFFRDGNAYTVKVLQAAFDKRAQRPAGPAHNAESIEPIHVEAVIPAPRDRVYEWYTTANGWNEFLGVNATVECRIGGPFEILFSMDPPQGQRGSEGCTVLSYVPGEMFSHTWNAPPTIPHCRPIHTWVVVRFDDLSPTRTRVRLSHFGFRENAAKEPDRARESEWTKTRAYFSNAWPRVLDALREHAAKQVSAPDSR